MSLNSQATVEQRAAVSSSRVCRMCRERGQTWSGDKPQCAFPSGVFVRENWNCATANALRDLCGQWENTNNDQNAAIIKGVEDCDHVLLTWYKRRGRTDGAWMVYDNRAPEPLTLAEAERIIAANAAAEQSHRRERARLAPAALLDALVAIVNTAQDNPDRCMADVCNENFIAHNLPLTAIMTGSEYNRIRIYDASIAEVSGGAKNGRKTE